jgi:alkanesulfonate monooxygenase SsuD/methylene tetrahydromethanopterin reductase-like flavin-dependent oxidoreductase (luciferase family)
MKHCSRASLTPELLAAILANRESDAEGVVMKVGIGLPSTVVGVSGGLLIEWARRADVHGFSSLGLIDRIAYPNYEVMVTLGALAAVTSTIRLMPAVLLGPTRSAGLLAKQAATVDAVSNGRLTLGLGIGARTDDYAATDSGYHDRGHRFERQLATLKRLWRGEPFSDEVGPIGPTTIQPGGPEILIGAFAPTALARVGRWADGYIGARPPSEMAGTYRAVEEGWRAAGRAGRPRFVSQGSFALGPDAAERGAANVRAYYDYWPERAEVIVRGLLTTPDAIREYVRACEDIGADEVTLNATIAELDQVERLRDAI